MNPLIATATATAALLVPLSCEQPPQPAPIRPAQVITIPEGYAHRFTAEAGDTLDVIMTPDPAWVDRCADMGGESLFNDHTLIATCHDVDF